MKLDSGDHSAKMKFSLSYENNLPFERAGNKTNFNQNEKFQTMAIWFHGGERIETQIDFCSHVFLVARVVMQSKIFRVFKDICVPDNATSKVKIRWKWHISKGFWIPAHSNLNSVNISTYALLSRISWWCTTSLNILWQNFDSLPVRIISMKLAALPPHQPTYHNHAMNTIVDWISFLPSALFRKFKGSRYIIYPRPSEGGYLSHTEIKISFSQLREKEKKSSEILFSDWEISSTQSQCDAVLFSSTFPQMAASYNIKCWTKHRLGDIVFLVIFSAVSAGQ